MSNLASIHGVETTGRVPTATTVVVQETTHRSKRQRALVKKGGGDEDAKQARDKNKYECRFYLMKFEKAQALGGHMNRHRQEREKEQLQHAQQIVSSMAQQQIPRAWSTLSVELTQNPLGPSDSSSVVSSCLSSHLSGSATHQPYVAPPISFGTLYRPNSPAHCNPRIQLPPSPGSNCNYYLSTNASSSSIPSNSNIQNQQQSQQWIDNMNGFSHATSNSSRSVPNSGYDSFHHHLVENMAISLQAAGVSSEFLANISLKNSNTSNDGNPLQVSSSTPISSQVLGTYDMLYNLQFTNAFYNGGM